MNKYWKWAAAMSAALGICTAQSSPASSGSLSHQYASAYEAHTRHALSAALVPFIENQGQVDRRVAFYTQTFAGTVFATRAGELLYALPAPDMPNASRNSAWLLKESFVGGLAKPAAGQRASTNVSVLTAKQQLPDVQTLKSVRLGPVWDGIDVEIHARGDNIEKVFTLQPGRDARVIQVRVEGAALSVAKDGTLVAMTGNGPLAFAAPFAYQELATGRRAVPVRYTVESDRYGFELGAHDASQPVIIDPIIQSTYFGGSGSSFAEEGARQLAIHPTTGEVYIAGITDSTDLPGVTGGAVSSGVSATGFVARFSADLTTLLQATYFGGSSDEDISTLLVTASDVYIAGHSAAGSLPAGGSPGAQPSDPNPGTVLNGFIARLPLSLTSVTASTFVGGSSDRTTRVLDATLHPNGDLYACGFTESATLPNTAGGFDSVNAFQNRTAFVARINATLGAFQQLTYFSDGAVTGNGAQCNAILADAGTNEIYIGGTVGFGPAPPNVAGGVLTTGNSGAWLARMNAALTLNPQSTWIAGAASGVDPGVFGLRQHPTNGDLYVLTSGRSTSPLPANATLNGGQPSCNGSFQCLLVMRVSPTLTSVVAGTFYGTASSSPIPRAFDHMAIDPASGDVFIASDGHTSLPNTAGGIQPAPLNSIGTPGFAARIRNDLGAIIQASYLTGSGTSGTSPTSVALHPSNGHLYVAGYTGSASFPQTSGGAQAAFGGASDGFVSRMTPDLLGAANAGTLQFSPAAYNITEGNTTAQVMVTRTGGTSGAVSVSYATSDGTATAGADYTAATGTLNWADGDGAAKSIDLPVLDDALAEPGEVINVALANAAGGATLGSQASATVTIADNDTAPTPQAGVVQLGAPSYSGNENGGSVTLTLTRTNGADGAISVSVAAGGGSAALGADYSGLSTSVSWASGDAAPKTVALDIINDAIDEPDETVLVTISSPTGSATLGAVTTATVTIVDDDSTPQAPSQAGAAKGSYGGGAFEWLLIVGVSLLLVARRLSQAVPRRVQGALALVLLLGTKAHAGEVQQGWYVGIRAGLAESTLDDRDVERALMGTGHAVTAQIDDGDTTAGVFAGFRSSTGWGLEAALIDLGEYDITLTGASADPARLLDDASKAVADAGRGASAALTWSFQLSEALVISPRLGGYYWESERRLSGAAGSVLREEHGVDATGGLSVAWNLSSNLSLGLAWDVFDAGGRNDIHAYTFALEYRFSQ